MHRTDHATRVLNLHGTGKDGYTAGQASTQTPPTVLTADAANAFQEEPANAVEMFGTALVKADNTQLRTALERVLDHSLFAHWSGQAASCIGLTSKGDAGTGLMTGAVSDTSQTIVCVFAGQTTNQVYSSTNGGSSFTSRSLGSASTASLRSVCWSPGLALFVAVGDAGEIQTSPDGVTWTKRTPGSAYAGDFMSVAWSEYHDKFVAVGSAGEVQTSSNGTAWTRLATGVGGFYRAVACKGDVVVAFSGNSYLFRSTNLAAFTETLHSTSTPALDAEEGMGLGVFGDMFVAMVNPGGVSNWSLLTSIDGSRWRVLATFPDDSITYLVSVNGVVSRANTAGEVLAGKFGTDLHWSRARPSAAYRSVVRTSIAWVAEDASAVVYCSALTP